MSQEINWASQVIDISSEFSGDEFSAMKALGEPDAMWFGSKRSNAWLPRRISSEEFIVLGFDNPTKVNQIVIAESENPGAIKSIFFYDEDLYEYTQLELEPGFVEGSTRFFHQSFDETPFDVHAIKVVMDVQSVPGRNTIDAVGIGKSERSLLNSIERKVFQDQRKFKTERLGLMINSPFEEKAPIISPDGQTLYFSRQFHPNNVGGTNDSEDIWYSKKIEEDKWSLAQNIGKPWNTIGPNFICSITRIDGKDYYLLGNIYDGEKMKEGVSLAFYENGVFTEPKALQIENLYNYSPGVDYYLVNKETLLLSIERDEGYGDRDIYVSFKRGRIWTEPKNLGPVINTFGEEASPQINSNGNMLYFSSNGFNGFGGIDMYVSERLDETWENWSEPLNLGRKVNGSGNENYFNSNNDLEDKFFTKRDSAGSSDIYHISQRPNMVLISGKVLDEANNAPIEGATVVYRNDNNQEYYATTNMSGDYQVIVSGGQTYIASGEYMGYQQVNPLQLDVDYSTRRSVGKIKMKRSKVPPPPNTETLSLSTFYDPETGQTYDCLTVFFDVNSSYINGNEFGKLQGLAKYLVSDKALMVELHGHSDSRSTAKYNEWLSQRRAERLADYLIKYGVLQDQITVLAFGESRPVINCEDSDGCSSSNHQANRRAELRIVNGPVSSGSRETFVGRR